MGRLESSSSLVLDAACGQLGPLSLLLGFTALCVQSSSQGSLFTVSLGRLDSSLSLSTLFQLSLFMALAIRSHACSVPLPPLSIHLLQLRLEFPVRRHHERSGSGHLSSSKCASLLRRFVSSVTSWMSLPPPWRSNGFQIPLNRGLIPCRFRFLHRAQSQPSDLGPPDPTPYARFARLTCSTDSARSTAVFSHLRCHASIAEWNRSAFSKTSYRSRAPRSIPPVSRARVPPLL
jgi:hypothetical protein